MSQMGRYIPTDDLYAANTLAAVQDIKKWLNGEVRYESSIGKFQEILMEMAADTPFDPASKAVRRGGDIPLVLPPGDDGFRHRRPVWKLIADQTASCGITTSSSNKVKAEWLTQRLNLCRQYSEYEAALTRFRGEVLGLNLEFQEEYEGFQESADVIVHGEFKARGERAKEDVKKMIDRLVLTLTKHMQKK